MVRRIMNMMREVRWDGKEDEWDGKGELECEGGEEDEGLMNGNEQNINDNYV